MISPKILLLCENLLAASKADNPCQEIDAFNALMNAVYEYDASVNLQNKATKAINTPSRLNVNDIWEFETEVKERGRMKPRTMQWRVVQWHTGELAWQLQSLDGKHFTYLMEFAPQYEDMKFIGTEKTS